VTNLTDKQKRFCDEYLIDLNATQAAIRAGYSKKTAYAIGEENLRKPEIVAEIQVCMKRLSERTEISQEKVLNELAKIGFFDIRKLLDTQGNPIPLHELDDHTAAAIAGLDILEEYDGTGKDRIFVGYVKKYKIADKRAALVDIGKHIGMFIDRKEHGAPGDFERLNDNELNDRLNAADEALRLAKAAIGSAAASSRAATKVK
jgi:phage terminase small subunit